MATTVIYRREIPEIVIFKNSQAPLKITRDTLEVSFFSGGAGGQNVNKHMNGVRLLWHIPAGYQKPGKPLEILSRSLEERSLESNFSDAFFKLFLKVKDYFYEKPRRTATRATKSSKEKRIQKKKRRGAIKAARQSKHFDL